MAFKSSTATVVRRKGYLIPDGFIPCAHPECSRYARYPTANPKVGYCLKHDKRTQALFEHANKPGRVTRHSKLSHILTADVVIYRPAEPLDLTEARKLRSLCGLAVDRQVALQSQWLSFTEGRYWLNVVRATARPERNRERGDEPVKLGKQFVCLACVQAYDKLVREEHLGLPGRMFVLRITAVENERVVFLHPDSPAVGQYVSRDLKYSFDLTANCMFAKLEDATAAAELFEDKYTEARVKVAVRRMVEDPVEDCYALDPLQERLAWYGGDLRASDGVKWQSYLQQKFGVEFRLPHEDTEGAD